MYVCMSVVYLHFFVFSQHNVTMTTLHIRAIIYWTLILSVVGNVVKRSGWTFTYNYEDIMLMLTPQICCVIINIYEKVVLKLTFNAAVCNHFFLRNAWPYWKKCNRWAHILSKIYFTHLNFILSTYTPLLNVVFFCPNISLIMEIIPYNNKKRLVTMLLYVMVYYVWILHM